MTKTVGLAALLGIMVSLMGCGSSDSSGAGAAYNERIERAQKELDALATINPSTPCETWDAWDKLGAFEISLLPQEGMSPRMIRREVPFRDLKEKRARAFARAVIAEDGKMNCPDRTQFNTRLDATEAALIALRSANLLVRNPPLVFTLRGMLVEEIRPLVSNAREHFPLPGMTKDERHILTALDLGIRPVQIGLSNEEVDVLKKKHANTSP